MLNVGPKPAHFGKNYRQN